MEKKRTKDESNLPVEEKNVNGSENFEVPLVKDKFLIFNTSIDHSESGYDDAQDRQGK